MTEKKLKVLLFYYVKKEEIQSTLEKENSKDNFFFKYPALYFLIDKDKRTQNFKKKKCSVIPYSIFLVDTIFTTYIIRNRMKDFGISL